MYKNLHIEPFNYAIKSVCFDFRSTNVGNSVIGTGRSEGSRLPYFYLFRCHYPLITYLNPALWQLSCRQLLRSCAAIIRRKTCILNCSSESPISPNKNVDFFFTKNSLLIFSCLQVNLFQKLFFLQNTRRTCCVQNCSECWKQFLCTTCSPQV